VVIVTGGHCNWLYTLFVMSQYNVIFTFAKQRFGEVFLTQRAYPASIGAAAAAGKAVKELKVMETYK